MSSSASKGKRRFSAAGSEKKSRLAANCPSSTDRWESCLRELVMNWRGPQSQAGSATPPLGEGPAPTRARQKRKSAP
eukprot:10720276-Alexandrium_andersonii.AAC.1